MTESARDDGAPATDSTMELVGRPADEALPQLFDRLGETIYHLGLAQCRNPEDAEDLLQETFLLAYRNWERFEGRSRPSTWLYAIASRVCQRRRRRKVGEPRTMDSLSELLPSGERKIPELPSDEDSPLDAQLRLEARRAVEAALQELPRSFRLALVLKDIAQLPVAEVATVLGLKEATVKTRVHRARLLLRKRLADTLPRKEAPPPDHPRGVCLDLLRGKQEALDRGVTSQLLEKELCTRCSALFSTLDLTAEVCQEIGSGEIPPELRERLMRDLG